MSVPRYACRNRARHALLQKKKDGTVNGIDWLEVVLDGTLDPADKGEPKGALLLLRFVHPLPAKDQPHALGPHNVVVEGGVRVREVGIHKAVRDAKDPHLLRIKTDTNGDHSTYTLRIVESVGSAVPPKGHDPVLSSVEFSFKVDCGSEFDCVTPEERATRPRPAPAIDYLAKDYASFRRLMLDRLSLLSPAWSEPHAADVGMALVEVVAHAADQLSYHQDAVATEAYLGTARRRVSVRRHARLLDYRMHEGCNARAWITVEVAPGVHSMRLRRRLDDGTRTAFTTRFTASATLDRALFEEAVEVKRPVFFEPMHDAFVTAAHNRIRLHDWGDEECCLPEGATSATLVSEAAAHLRLRPGDVLILEEVLSPRNGLPEDADPARRHAVRLTKVAPEATVLADGWSRAPPAEASLVKDPLTDAFVVHVEWAAADALPFPLVLSSRVDDSLIRNVSVARGNVVLADHGRTLGEPVEPAEVPETGDHRPRLPRGGVTYRVPTPERELRRQPARAALAHDPRAALPDARLHSEEGEWTPRRDLVDTPRFAQEFVLEVEGDGEARARFGDGENGRRPLPGTRMRATFRVGNGAAGNVGAESLAHVGPDVGFKVVRVRNPLPAVGGVDPEATERVRISAPQAFRGQERAVTEADYQAAAQRHPDVQRAVARRRWTGSWFTTFLTIDRREGRPVDAAFEREMRNHLERFRLSGHDVEIEPPRFVPLEIAMGVCVEPTYHASDVKLALLKRFSSRDHADGHRGFFHPDHFTFGDTVWLSKVVAAAMEVPGVRWVDLEPSKDEKRRFGRQGEKGRADYDEGRITMGKLEIPRLDNDPSQPENGRIDFLMEGGL